MPLDIDKDKDKIYFKDLDGIVILHLSYAIIIPNDQLKLKYKKIVFVGLWL